MVTVWSTILTSPNCILAVELSLFHSNYWNNSKCFNCIFPDLNLYIFKKFNSLCNCFVSRFLKYLLQWQYVYNTFKYLLQYFVYYFFIEAVLITIKDSNNSNRYWQVDNSDRGWQVDKLIFTWESLYLSLYLPSHVIFITTTKSKSY